jgi:hypothetical protein
MYKYVYIHNLYGCTCMRRPQRLAAQEAGLRCLLPKLRRSKLLKNKMFFENCFLALRMPEILIIPVLFFEIGPICTHACVNRPGMWMRPRI